MRLLFLIFGGFFYKSNREGMELWVIICLKCYKYSKLVDLYENFLYFYIFFEKIRCYFFDNLFGDRVKKVSGKLEVLDFF